MFVASLTRNAEPIAVLLGGFGKYQNVAPRQDDNGALLSRPRIRPNVFGATPLGSSDPLHDIGRHD